MKSKLHMTVATVVVIAGAAAGAARAVDYPNKMEGKAKIACGFETDLVFNRKLDAASQYVTDNFVEHNTRANTTNMKDFQAALQKMPKFGSGPAQTCPAAKVVLSTGDYVVFVREGQQDNPQVPGTKMTVSHFDVFRFEGNKIAEHWD